MKLLPLSHPKVISTLNSEVDNIINSHIQTLALNYEENYAAGRAMRKYHKVNNAFIHFTDYAKMVPNPDPRHKDPIGIYFYPIKWLLKNSRWGQYALAKDNYFIAKVSLSKVLKMRGFTRTDGEEIAERNGWLEYLNKAYLDTSLIRKDYPRTLLQGKTKDAAMFYAVADTLANSNNFGKRIPWSKTLKGLKGIYDNTNKGIINEEEPSQLLVLDPSLIDLVESGENYSLKSEKEEKAFRKITEDYNGEFKDGVSYFDFEGAPLKVDWDSVTFDFFQDGIKTNKSFSIPLEVYDYGEKDLYNYFSYILKKFLGEYDISPKGNSSGYSLEDLESLAKELGASGINWRRYNRVKDGVLVYSGNIKNIFGYFLFVLSSYKDGKLKVRLQSQVNYDYPLIMGGSYEEIPIKSDYEFERVFPSEVTPEEIKSEVSSDLRSFLEELPAREKLPLIKLQTLYHFNIDFTSEDVEEFKIFKGQQ